MPLLMCPNCNAAMQELKRDAVAFDMCPTCRGVWLDRGELEKLIAAGRGEASPTSFGASPPPHAPPQPRPYRHDDDDDDYRRHHGAKRKRGLDIFDIFD